MRALIPAAAWPDGRPRRTRPDAPGGVGRAVGGPPGRTGVGGRLGPHPPCGRGDARRAHGCAGFGPGRVGCRPWRPGALVCPGHHLVRRGPPRRAALRCRAGAAQPVRHRLRDRPRGRRRRAGPGALRSRSAGCLCGRPGGRAPRGPGSHCCARRGPRRPAAAPARRRRADRLHLGDHRQAQRRGAHARLAAGGCRCVARGLAVGCGGPAHPRVAALPRARPVRRAVRHADRRRIDHGVRPLRRGGGPGCRVDQHHVLRRADHVPPAGGVRSGFGARAAAPVRVGVGAAGRGPVAPAGRRRGRRVGALRHDRDAPDAVQPLRGRAPPRLGRIAPAGRGGRARRRRRAGHRGAARARPIALPGVLGPRRLRPR